MSQPKSPSHYNVHHEEWRPHQGETVEWLLNGNNKINIVQAPVGSGKCLSVDSWVATPMGMCQIKDVDPSVMGWSPKGGFQSRSVNHIFDTKERKCLEITTSKGYSLICTPEHKILILNTDGVYQWVPAGGLNEGDYVVMGMDRAFPKQGPYVGPEKFSPRGKHHNQISILPPDYIDEEIAYFLGALIGDGTLGRRMQAEITTPDPEIVASFRKIADRFGLNVGLDKKEGNKATTYRAHSIEFRQWLEFLGLDYKLSVEKEIPWVIWRSPESIVAAFLRGLFDTDGSADKSSIEYGTSSTKLANQLQILLLKIGIVSNKSYRPRTDSYRLYIGGLSLRVFQEKIGFTVKHKRENLEYACSKKCNPNKEIVPNIHDHLYRARRRFKAWCRSRGLGLYKEMDRRPISDKTIQCYMYGDENPSKLFLRRMLAALPETEMPIVEHFAYNDLFYDPVASVEEAGVHSTVDISVAVDNNFIANGFLVHNSATVAALGSRGRTITAVTVNLALQKQYEEYGFTSLSGMANYECMFNPMLTTDMCSFAPMHECPVFASCLYIKQKEAFKHATRGSLNYAYFLHADWLRNWPKSWVALDEAHEIREILIDHLSINFGTRDCVSYKIPFWHQKKVASRGIRLMHASSWLEDSLRSLSEQIEKLKPLRNTNPKIVRKLNKLNQLASKMNDIYIGISSDADKWFAWFDEDEIKISPLSVANYFESFFTASYDSQFLLMSGTIGNHESFTRALGIKDYAFRAVPSRFPPESRPVYDLRAPRMSYGAGPLAHEKQADLIGEALDAVPREWSGILHVNSRAKASALAQRLSKRGFEDRVYIIKGRGTRTKLDNWYLRKREVPNSLGISYSFGQGVDLYEENINISCDVPFASLANPTVKARADYDPATYSYSAALRLEQRNGRTRRGREEDYDDGYSIAGINAIADSNYRLIDRHFSQDFRQCITTW